MARACCWPARPRPSRRVVSATKREAESFFFLHTDDFWRDYREMTERKVRFTREPREEPYGTVAVFEDLYGNQWDLLQLKNTKLL